MTEPWQCVICGDTVDMTKHSGWAQRVEGWDEIRQQGGGNKILGREVIPNTVAHVPCIRWGAPGQEKML